MKLMSIAMLCAAACGLGEAQAAVPGIVGTSTTPAFALTAAPGYNSQPDGAQIYVWGYGCTAGSGPSMQTIKAGQGPAPKCPEMQMPGPTMIVNEGDTVSVTLTNKLPAIAGNASLVFPGMGTVTTSGGAPGLLTQEATPGSPVTYSFKASKPGTYAYYSGTQPDLQIEMGLFGAIVVKPTTPQATCRTLGSTLAGVKGEVDSRLAPSAYDHPDSCYDREYLFQFSEMNSKVHDDVQAQAMACPTAPCPQASGVLEPYHPNYFLINGRSMPDLMDTPFAAAYPNQPYNGNPHMHPGEKLLMRVVGQGRLQHPFHFHGNHARVLARDGNMLLSAADNTSLAGPLLFTIATVSGQSVDAIFTWSGKGLNWDVYNHVAGDGSKCTPDASGFHSVKSDPNYGEWCADHAKPMPVTAPDPQIVANGQWYGGTPYLGLGGGFNPVNLPPGTLNQNPGAGYAYMWHSHNEREITTNDVFPGGLLMMLIIDPPQWPIDETQ
ncbi:MAG: multicopper oxidase domain-containing protein [Pseudomonadota bacterium]|nr:multicopper oxidase domain-containing protein [Pseudomonadota bacterium]